MRTNIEIDEKLIEEARRITGLPSKKAIVEAALQEMIRRARASREVADYFGQVRVGRQTRESRQGRSSIDPRRQQRLDRLLSWRGQSRSAPASRVHGRYGPCSSVT